MTLVKNKLLWLAVPLLCAAVAALVVAGAGPGPNGENTLKQSDLALGQPPAYQDPIEELSLTLTSSGFAPGELRPHGKKFLLSLDNRTDAKELVLRMSRNDGVQIREIRVPGGSGDWSELFELPAGKYMFSEVNHANWLCTIIISE
jgi:hypothetical protein